MRLLPASLISLLLFITLNLPLSVQASVVHHMFETTSLVADQGLEARSEAFKQGFIEVLVRISGNSATPTSIDVDQASHYVQEYRYIQLAKQVPLPLTENSQDAAGAMATHQLWVKFNEGAIKQLLRDNNLPIWGRQRPNVLLWLAVRDGRNRYILKNSHSSAIKDAVTREAKRRGLPIMWPTYNARDQKLLGFADLWGQFWDPVKKASAAYNVDAIMIGRMDWKNGSWSVDWALSMEDLQEHWSLRATSLEDIMASGVDVGTDQIASRFSVFEDMASDGNISLRVENLSVLDAYARVSHYLRSIALVKSVYAAEVNQDNVLFNITLVGDSDDLKRVIALGDVLTPVEIPEPPPAPVAPVSPATPPQVVSSGDNPAPAPAKPTHRILNYRFNS